MKSGSNSIQRTINILTVIAAFAFMLYLTVRCPYITDDWHFKFVWKDFDLTGSDTRVSSLGDIFTSVKNYYLNSGGRALCHFLVYIFVNINKNIYNVINAIMFVLLGILIYRTAARRNTPPKYNCMLLLIYAAMMLFMPLFGDVCLWLSGSINYMWSAVMLLACFLLIDKCFDCLTLKKALLMSIPVAISAATNEMTGGMLIVFIALMFIVKKKKFSLLYLIPMLATLPGMALVILAPGNYVRATEIDKYEFMAFEKIIRSAANYFSNLFENTSYLYMLIFFTFLVKFKDALKSEKTKRFKVIAKNALYILSDFRYAITGFSGVMALSLSAPTHRPMIFGYVCFIAEGFSCLIYIMNRIGKRNTRYKIRPHEIWYFALILMMPYYMRYLGNAPAFLVAALTEAVVLAAEKVYAKNKKPSEKAPIKFPMGLAVCCAAAVVCMAVIAIDTAKYNDSVDKMNDYYAQLKTAVTENDMQTVAYMRFALYDATSPFFSNEFRKNGDSYTREWYALYIVEEHGDENLQVIQYFLSAKQQNAEN